MTQEEGQSEMSGSDIVGVQRVEYLDRRVSLVESVTMDSYLLCRNSRVVEDIVDCVTNCVSSIIYSFLFLCYLPSFVFV